MVSDLRAFGGSLAVVMRKCDHAYPRAFLLAARWYVDSFEMARGSRALGVCGCAARLHLCARGLFVAARQMLLNQFLHRVEGCDDASGVSTSAWRPTAARQPINISSFARARISLFAMVIV